MKNLFIFFILIHMPLFGMEVTFYNIGQGNCTLVTYPGKKTMLVDAGFSKEPLDDPHCDTVTTEIIATIKSKTPQKQLFVVASHADKDHINLLTRICGPLLKDAFTIEFLLGGTPAFYKKKEGKELLSFIEKNKQICKKTFASDITGDDRAKQFAALIPSYGKVLSALTTSEKKLDPNDTSIVLKVRDGAFSALLPGDATGNVTNPLINTKALSLLSTIYELSHHGAESHLSTTLALLLAINPRILILSSGLYEGNFMHPRFETIRTAAEFCVKRNRTGAQPHMLTYQNSNGVPPYKGKTDETRLNLVAINDDGFCTSQTTFPIYHTADLGTITCSKEGVSASKITNEEERGIAALTDIQTPRFNGIRFLFFNNMEIESAQLTKNLTTFPNALEYLDLRNNLVGHIGIEHLITLYKTHKNNLIVKLGDNRLVDKKALTTICNKKTIKSITSKNRIIATFSKKGLAKDTVESLEFRQGISGNPPAQHAQAKDYAQDNSIESIDACKNKFTTTNDDIEQLVYELSSDKKNLYIERSDNPENGYSYAWARITDICILNDANQTVSGITTNAHSTIFDFERNLFKDLEGKFKYTNPLKPWKTIGKEFWSLDEPGTNYYHEHSPFSNNGKFVMTVSEKNKCINIYQIDQLSFDPQDVKLYKKISEEELKNDLGHVVADIKRVSFTDSDHSVKLNFTDNSHGELRYILQPNNI